MLPEYSNLYILFPQQKKEKKRNLYTHLHFKWKEIQTLILLNKSNLYKGSHQIKTFL